MAVEHLCGIQPTPNTLAATNAMTGGYTGGREARAVLRSVWYHGIVWANGILEMGWTGFKCSWNALGTKRLERSLGWAFVSSVLMTLGWMEQRCLPLETYFLDMISLWCKTLHGHDSMIHGFFRLSQLQTRVASSVALSSLKAMWNVHASTGKPFSINCNDWMHILWMFWQFQLSYEIWLFDMVDSGWSTTCSIHLSWNGEPKKQAHTCKRGSISSGYLKLQFLSFELDDKSWIGLMISSKISEVTTD